MFPSKDSLDGFSVIQCLNFEFESCHFGVLEFKNFASLYGQWLSFFCQYKVRGEFNLWVHKSSGKAELSEMGLNGVREFSEGFEALVKNDGFSGNSSSGGELGLFEGAKDQFALLFGFVCEEESDVTFQ